MAGSYDDESPLRMGADYHEMPEDKPKDGRRGAPVRERPR